MNHFQNVLLILSTHVHLVVLADFLSRNLLRLSENWSLRRLRCRERWSLFWPRNPPDPPLPACPPSSAPSTTRSMISTPSLIFITKSKMKLYLVAQCSIESTRNTVNTVKHVFFDVHIYITFLLHYKKPGMVYC